MEDKDRLGTKLHQKEQAEESRYFAERDRALIDKMKEQREAEQRRGDTGTGPESLSQVRNPVDRPAH